MSGAYVLQSQDPREDLQPYAALLSAQLLHPGAKVNHYAARDGLLLGAVTPDPLGRGVMPRFIASSGMWGLMLGRLYESDALARLRGEYPGAAGELELLAAVLRGGLAAGQGAGPFADALAGLNGAFFVILFDPDSQMLVAANDRFGLIPMYWSHRAGRFCLAGRVLCSVLAGVVDGDWNPAGVAQLLTTGDLAGETTLVQGVESFPQASVLVKQGADDFIWKRYWHYEYKAVDKHAAPDDMAEELGALFIAGVKRQARGADSVGVTLSGGLDSRCIVAAAAKAGLDIKTYTWGKRQAFDRTLAGRVAQAYATEHTECDYRHANLEARHLEAGRITEGMTSAVDAHMLYHLDVLPESLQLILDGYAGGVILGGSFLRSSWMHERPVAEVAQALFGWRNTLIPERELGRALAEPGCLGDADRPSAFYERILAAISERPSANEVDRFFLENRQRRHTVMGSVALRTRVETAASFFDYDFVDAVTRVPPPLRKEHRIHIAVMRHAFPEALRIPWQRTLLPAGAPEWQVAASRVFLKGCHVLKRKTGHPRFIDRMSPIDLAKWLREPLHGWMGEVCTAPGPVLAEVVDPAFCAATWEEHRAGADRSLLLGAIASLRGFAMALGRAREKEPWGESRPVQVEIP